MKKITSLIVALIFTISIALAVINTSNSTYINNKGHSYVSISPPPPPGKGGTQ